MGLSRDIIQLSPQKTVLSITIWLFNIAMENPYKWRFPAGKIIHKWDIFHGYVKQPEGNILMGISLLTHMGRRSKDMASWKPVESQAMS